MDKLTAEQIPAFLFSMFLVLVGAAMAIYFDGIEGFIAACRAFVHRYVAWNEARLSTISEEDACCPTCGQPYYVKEDEDGEGDDTPVAEPQRASNNNAATSNNGVAISQNEQQQVVVVAGKAAALAALVAAGKVGETEGIRIVFGCAPSSSNPKYLTARAALKLALSALEDGPRFVVRDENGEAKLDANGKLVTAPRNGRKED